MNRCKCGATGKLMFANCCRDCFNAERCAQRHADPLPELERGRRWQAENWYGITLERREQMAVDQDYCCLICKAPEVINFGLGRLEVEHCHYCIEVRGLVCHTCNQRIQRHEVGGNVPADLVGRLNDYINTKCRLDCRVRRDVALRARKRRRPRKSKGVMA